MHVIGRETARIYKQSAQIHYANRHGFPSGPYDGLSVSSKLVHRLTPTTGSAQQRVNLLLNNVTPQSQFAGVKTALRLAGKLAQARGVPLRIVALNFLSQREIAKFCQQLPATVGFRNVEVESLLSGRDVEFTTSDVWVATYWTTAHILDVASRSGLIKPVSVLYLVQDYEPCFMPWSTDAALAQATYHAGFHLVVNSGPLRDYLADVENVVVSDEFTFAPALDDAALAQAAAGRQRLATTRVFFYARPSKPRNLFHLGATTLRLFAEQYASNPALSSRRIEVVTAGEANARVGLSKPVREVNLGQTSWSEYYEVVRTSDVTLSLMMSPHPSHPPLEAAISGGYAVTNAFGRYRNDVHPRLLTAPLDPELLAKTLLSAVERAVSESAGVYQPLADGSLGHDFDEVVARCASIFRR